MDPVQPLPQVSVILVNWNLPTDTLECIRSLRESTYGNLDIVVVDNGSSDDSVDRIKRAGDEITLLETGDNLGFSGGTNYGLKYAMEHGADYLLMLNTDTVIAADAIEEMVAIAESDSTIGIVSPKILFFDYPEMIWSAGSEIDFRLFTKRTFGFREKDEGRFDQVREISFATGCAMMVPRFVIERVGFLCDDFFLVMEDLDYSIRVLNQGFRIVYVPSAIVWHKVSLTAGGHDAPQYVYYQTRNSLLIRSRLASSQRRFLVYLAVVMLFYAKRTLEFIWQRKWRSILGILFGVLDAITGQVGRRERGILKTFQPIDRS